MAHQTIIVMGVSGVGKTSVAVGLSNALGGTYLEADDYHPPANIKAMKHGIRLTDEMRMPWLKHVASAISEQKLETENVPIVAACSALKRIYRDTIRDTLPDALFVHLTGSEELITKRMGAREDHFMPLSLLQSQLATLEPLRQDESHICVDIAGTKKEVIERALAALTTRAQ